MADEPVTPTTTPSTTAAATPPPEPTPPTPPGGVNTDPPPDPHAGFIPKDKYDEALTRLRAYEDTLRAMNPPTPPSATPQPALADPITAIAHRLGTSPDEARQWAQFLTPYFQAMAGPYVQALATLNDRYDALQARSALPDYTDYADAIERERASRAARNEYVSHTDAYHLVKSREMPRLLERERQRFVDEQRRRDAQVSAIGPETTTTQTAAPSPTKPSSNVSAEDFSRMTLAEKEAFLADKTF